MPSPLRLIRRCAEYVPEAEGLTLPRGLHGIYVLYRQLRAVRTNKPRYDVVYVGMASKGGIRSRLRLHRRQKQGHWTHFSVFQVWDNIREDEVRELEGLFRHIYRHDSHANRLNAARGFKAVREVRLKKGAPWPRS